jgi:hypothetical protein
MDYSNPNLDFNLEAASLIKALKQAEGMRDARIEPQAQLVNGRAMFGAGPGGILAQGVDNLSGMIRAPQIEQQQRDLSAEQGRRMDDMINELATPGTKRVLRQALRQGEGPLLQPNIDETQETVPLNPLEENNRRMGIAMKMSKLPQATSIANSMIQQGIAFPEKMAQLQQKGQERLMELQLRLEDRGLDRASREAIARQMDETRRWMASLQAQTSMAIQGMRNDAAAARDANKPDGKPLTRAETQDLVKIQEAGDTLTELNKTWKPDNAGWGAVGEVVRKLDSTLGSWGSKDMQGRNEWWSKYEMLVELPTRNAMFGSALTAPERALWNQARMIKPGADPKAVEKAVKDMLDITNRKKDMVGESMIKGGKSRGAVEAITGAPSMGDFEVIERK